MKTSTLVDGLQDTGRGFRGFIMKTFSNYLHITHIHFRGRMHRQGIEGFERLILWETDLEDHSVKNMVLIRKTT